MKTKYESFDNLIIVSVITDSGNMLCAICYIYLSVVGSMRVIDNYDIRNYCLTPVKFSVFCRSIVNSSLPILEKCISFSEPDPELDFELR